METPQKTGNAGIREDEDRKTREVQGSSIFETLERLKADMADEAEMNSQLRKQLAEFKAQFAENEIAFAKVRTDIALLRPYRDLLLTSSPNATSQLTPKFGISCGGHILADSMAIDQGKNLYVDNDNAQVQAMTENFAAVYGISHAIFKKHIPTAPSEIWDCFNMAFDVGESELWDGKMDNNARDNIRNRCEKILNPWKTWILTDQVNGSPIVDGQEYDEVKRMYNSFRLGLCED